MPSAQEITRYDTLLERLSAACQDGILRACSKADITPTQYFALDKLALHGETRMSAFAEHLALTPGAATLLVDRLLKHELVERFLDPADRRVVHVRLSTKGAEALATVQEAKCGMLRPAFDRLSASLREQLIAGLTALMAAWPEQEEQRDGK